MTAAEKPQRMTPEEFRALIDVMGITVAEAAEELLRPPSTLYRWLRGKAPIPEVVARVVRRWPEKLDYVLLRDPADKVEVGIFRRP
jgi:predicted transcriptional regulator